MRVNGKVTVIFLSLLILLAFFHQQHIFKNNKKIEFDCNQLTYSIALVLRHTISVEGLSL